VKDQQQASLQKIPDILEVSIVMVELTREELQRYSRHLILPEVGKAGQERLKAASILLIGTGGLGSPLGLYLAAAGVGRLGLVDYDVVDYSNLQRQIIHGTKDVGRPKIESAVEKLKDINPAVQLDTYNEPFTSANALRIAKPYDIIIDGTDNFPTRYLTNDVCVMLGKPNVYGAIFRFEGQATVFHYQDGPCYRCLYPEPPDPGMVPSCAEGGVLGVLPGIIGVIQATEAIKIILGQGTTLSGRLLLYDALTMKFREMKVRRDEDCPVCGNHPTITQLIDYEQFCGMPAHDRVASAQPQQATAKADDEGIRRVTPAEVKAMLDRGEDFTFIDVREPHEYDIVHIPGAQLVPLSELQIHVDELDRSKPVVAHCHHGGRSLKALKQLQAWGFTDLRNVVGGIDRWAQEVDPTMPRY
jgi:adenylyltransferase/sulfurtransferase